MKTHLFHGYFLLLALCALAPAAAAREVRIDVVPARHPANGDEVVRGTSRVLVALRLGQPSITLPDGTWVYRGYVAHPNRADAFTGNLIVRFDRGRVRSLSIANEAMLVALRPQAAPASDRERTAAAARR
ncbi:MAG TPA: hypothetical protein VEB66_10105 [Opitutaceae bacterium]|nr:hypothetical protein [Opitutaceae bacterium]